MTFDAPASELSRQDCLGVVDCDARPPSTACRDRRREIAIRAALACDFLHRAAHAQGVHAVLMKSSTIKLAESRRLLAEVSDLLRR